MPVILRWMRMPRRRREAPQLGVLALVALAATLLSVAARAGSAGDEATRVAASAWRGLVGAPRQEVAVGQRVIVVLNTPALSDQIAHAGGRAGEAQQRRWTTASLAASHQLLAKLAQEGVRVRPEYIYSRVIAGFSAPIDPQVLGLLEHMPEVAGVYPVRVTYPAAQSSEMIERQRMAAGAGDRLRVSLPGFDGNGVTVALLDTGVEGNHPFLLGQVVESRDVIDRDGDAAPDANPDDASRLERHGTQLAGIVAGSEGPAELAGVAPRATLLPIRVAGWQQNARGTWGLFGRTDQLVAGLERAVDPNGDGSAHDAARVALVGVTEPFSAFVDSPAARATAGALRLDTLVVAPAGNDGSAGPGYGSIGGPGGSPSALTVGAVDMRANTQDVRVVLRNGLDLSFDRRVPLAGAVAPRRHLSLRAAAPRLGPESRSGERSRGVTLELEDFFDEGGRSLVAGRAAVVPAGADPGLAAAQAVRAGAAAVVLYGPTLPAGGIGLDEAVSVPVVSVPAWAARNTLAALRAGRRPLVAIGTARSESNRVQGHVAAFSSRGLAFDGRVKPDLVAPGVALLTAEPGRGDEGAERYASVSGSSASAAAVAGAAALLAQARPELDAPALKALLVGTARPLERDSVVAQGAGLLDVGAAAVAEAAVLPATLSFDKSAARTWQATRKLIVRNLSSRPLRLRIATDDQQTAAASGLVFGAAPSRVTVAPGQWAPVFVTGRIAFDGSPAKPIEGLLLVRPEGGVALRVPWLISFRPARRSLLGELRLATASFKASDAAPTVLSFRAGQVERAQHGWQIAPVAKLDLELFDAKGERLGLLGRLRDLLPGHHSFGLTGRDAEGNELDPGRYRVRLTAWPTGDGKPSRASVAFSIK
jgi:subtilisin family serine protease